MNSIITPYGKIVGIEFRTLYSNGKTDGCLVSSPNILKTPYGELVPQYESEDMGRRPVKPLYFYKKGSIKSIALQTQTMVSTPVGHVPAELITFHESGSIKRVFPLDGKLTGFWTSKNELTLAESLTIDSPLGSITAKFIGLQFYESGSLKSITLWPGQQLTVMTPAGKITLRTGIAFYENGKIRSLELANAIEVPTIIGPLTAYDNEPRGIHGDLNSLQFGPEGNVEGLSTTTDALTVIDHDGQERRFTPGIKDNLCGAERKVVVPMKIRFNVRMMILNENPQHAFNLDSCRIRIEPFDRNTAEPSYSCAG
jgi:hypothetical protein